MGCRWLRLLVVAVVGAGSSLAVADDNADRLVGGWLGTIKVPIAGDLRLAFRVEKGEDGKLKALLDSPDQEAFGMAVDQVSVAGDAVKFGVKEIRGTFEGTMAADGQEIKGRWRQAVPLDLTLTKVDVASLPKAVPLIVPDGLDGLWEGRIQIQAGIELRLVLNVEADKEGNRKATLESPDQNAKGLRISSISLDDGTLEFESKSLMASFEGKRNEDGTAFEGQFKQLGRTMPLTLKRTKEVILARRPQNPTEPLPYKVEEVSFENTADDVKLAGSLTLPEGDGPFPAVVLITGSGPQDRDEALLGHKPFLVLSDYLTRRGIAVLRCDDRGVGGSTGQVMISTSEDFAEDALAGVAFLKKHAKIDPARIGLVGHSEGGIVAPIAAAKSDGVAFIVLMAGTGLPGTEILRLQSRLIAQAGGASEQALGVQATLLERTFEVLAAEDDDKTAVEKLKAATADLIKGLPKDDLKWLEESTDESALTAGLQQMATPWFRYFLTFDPRTALGNVKCPVLAINGERDLQVPPKENLAEIEKALKEAGNSRVTIREMPGLNHLFQTSKTGAPSEYGKIEETFAPAALEVIGDWILEQGAVK